MSHSRPMDPRDAERRFAELLDEAGLPRFHATRHRPDIDEIQFIWDHGVALHHDLTREIEPIDDWDRAMILGEPVPCGCEPIHVTVPGTSTDPREDRSIPGIVIHRTPPLHPDDLTVFNGIPMTSPSRTMIDCAESMTKTEVREMFARARELGLLDSAAMHAARARVEWRPSLAMLDEVIAEFCD